jgi:hypothetical protein
MEGLMPVINQTASILEVSNNFGILLGMIAAAVVLFIIVWIFTQFRRS